VSCSSLISSYVCCFSNRIGLAFTEPSQDRIVFEDLQLTKVIKIFIARGVKEGMAI